MRPLRVFRELRRIENGFRTSKASESIARRQTRMRRGYCSVCDSTAPVAPAIKKWKSGAPPPPPSNLAVDHREIGSQLELFVTSKYSPGSPLFLPHGTKVFNKLTDFLRAQYEKFGFQEVITPTIYKKSLWEKSGHWDNYADDMYAVIGRGASGPKEGQQVGEHEQYGLKPMNCPGHCLLFASKRRSYRELPIRYADFSPLHRNEVHGSLSGLTRTRRFHQDDGHIFCRPIQIKEEISKTLEFVKMTYGVFRLGTYRLALSTRPAENFIGSVEEWDNAERALRESLDASGLAWSLNEGDGAFYGPKIDIILKDSDGKEHQTATIQLDFQLPKRFELVYRAPAPENERKGIASNGDELAKEGSVTPVLIHRAVLGSVERMMALLIENYGDQWPFWLSPRQVIILTVSEAPEVLDYVQYCQKTLRSTNDDDGDSPLHIESTRLSIDVDTRPISVSRKITEARSLGYSVIAVVGQKDVKNGTLVVDFSRIPANNGFRKSMTLKRALLRQEPDRRPKLPEDDSALTIEQIRKAELGLGWLKRTLLEFQKSFW